MSAYTEHLIEIAKKNAEISEDQELRVQNETQILLAYPIDHGREPEIIAEHKANTLRLLDLVDEISRTKEQLEEAEKVSRQIKSSGKCSYKGIPKTAPLKRALSALYAELEVQKEKVRVISSPVLAA